MRRDAADLAVPDTTPTASRVVRRTPAYVGEGANAFLSWYHESDTPPCADRFAVLCPPAGSEYTRSHRTLRHLADRLARAGIPTLRFDYPGTGDSPGDDLDPHRLEAWRAAIVAAVQRARALSGREEACLVGVRLGATLAAQVSAEVAPQRLVLWNPHVSGRACVRELRALAMAAERTECGIEGGLEAAGFVTSAETLASIQTVDLLQTRIRARERVLVVGRDDASPDRALGDRLDADGVPNDFMRLPGWAGMMAEHQFTVVPDAALEATVAWLAQPAPGALPSDSAGARDRQDALRQAIEFDFEAQDGTRARLEERICRFGADDHLFGILSRPAPDPKRGQIQFPPDLPVVILFNAGAAHHVGPNRIYVELARNLSVHGLPCLRFDLESLGDSVNRVPARENYPYPRTATVDGAAAIRFLRERFGFRRFIALGLCSGAHTVFHLGLDLPGEAIEELVLVNPMQFHWVEGMSLDTSRRFEDMVRYRHSMRDPRRWVKLARGNVNFRRMAEVVWGQARVHLRSWIEALAELALPHGGPRLSRDLKRLFGLGRRLTLLVSEGDPGRDVLMANARLTAARALRSGAIRLQMIPEADHTFSRRLPRRDLIARTVALLGNAASSYSRNGPV